MAFYSSSGYISISMTTEEELSCVIWVVEFVSRNLCPVGKIFLVPDSDSSPVS